MKVLVVGHKPAYPKIDGGCVASAAFLNDLLSANCQVHYAFLHTEKHPFQEEALTEEFRALVPLTPFFIETKVRKVDAFKYLFNSKSFNVERFYSKEFEHLLNNLIQKNSFDAIIFDNVFAARYQSGIKKLHPTLPSYIRSHNVEFEIWEDLSKSSSNGIVRWYLSKLAKDLKRFELSAYNVSNGVMTITQDDADALKKYGVQTSLIHIGVSVQIPDQEHNYSYSNLFHLGAMNWRPNVEAVDTVLKYLPVWLEKDPEISFTIAGLQATERYDHLENPSISVAGFVPDVSEFVKTQGILVAPIQSGSGVRIKILEMMAHGIPIITTTLGAQGITDLSGVFIADNHESMAEAVYTLRNDEKKRRELGQKAKSIITLHHNSETVSKKILEFISRK